jgi:archaellum component FlaG (FlaF/FlaG flagellin family)
MATDMISTAIIGIATLIIVSTLIAALFPQVFEMAGSVRSITGTANDRAGTSATVVNYDVPAADQLQFDVLNNGQSGIVASAINMSAVYLDNQSLPGNLLARGASTSSQYWDYVVTGDGDGEWEPGEMLEVVVVSPGYSIVPGDYQLKMLLYNGAAVQYGFTI